MKERHPAKLAMDLSFGCRRCAYSIMLMKRAVGEWYSRLAAKTRSENLGTAARSRHASLILLAKWYGTGSGSDLVLTEAIDPAITRSLRLPVPYHSKFHDSCAFCWHLNAATTRRISPKPIRSGSSSLIGRKLSRPHLRAAAS